MELLEEGSFVQLVHSGSDDGGADDQGYAGAAAWWAD